MYVTHFPLRNYLFDLSETSGQREVGKVATSVGTLRREIQGQSEFKTIQTGERLYNLDTLVTDPETKVSVALDDGGVIEVGPGSMVKLSFENQYSLGGISRRANVEVISGTVTSKAGREQIVVKSSDGAKIIPRNSTQTVKIAARKPIPKFTPIPNPVKATPSPTLSPVIAQAAPSPSPSPSPSPIPVSVVRLVSPRSNQKISLPKNPTSFKAEVSFAWTVDPVETPSSIHISQVSPNRVAVLHKTLPSGKPTQLKAAFKFPGTYEWEIKNEKNESLSRPVRGRFEVLSEFTGIEVLPPLIAGQKMINSALQDKLYKKFDLTLNWKPYSGANGYRVEIYDSTSMNKRLLEKEVSGTKYQINRNQVMNGSFFYRVSSKMEHGFVATSELTSYGFKYLPPNLVLPADLSTIVRKAIVVAKKGILFTWRATNFTESYVIEIASDASFTKMVLNSAVIENFYVLKLPPNGTYFWRVKSKTKNMISSPSKTNQFVVID